MTTRNARELKQLLNRSKQWRQQHDIQFEKSKYILIHFTHNLTIKKKVSVIIDGIRIQSSMKTKYLDIIFDQKLKFHIHDEQVMIKAIKYIFIIIEIVKSKWDSKFKYLRHLFTAITVSWIDYTTIIWYRPNDIWIITEYFHIIKIIVMEHETGLLSSQ